MLNINRSKQCNKMSPIQNYVCSFRYTGEIPRSDLVDMVTKAMTKNNLKKNSSAEWFDQLPWIGSKEIPTVEHHIYCYNDGVFDIISDYEPRFVIRNSA